MKKIALIAIFFLSPTFSTDAIILNLKKAISLAIQNNHILKKLEKDNLISNLNYKQSLTSYLPQIGFSLSWETIKDHPYIDYDENLEYSLTLSQYVLNVEQIANIHANAFLAKYQFLQYEDYKQLLILNTIKVFYRCILAEENLKTRQRAFNLAKEQERIAKIRYKQGEVSYYDLLRAESNFLTAKAKLREAQAQYKKDYYELKYILAYNIDQEIKVKGKLAPITQKIGLEELIKTHPSPKLLAMDNLIKAKEQKLRLTKAKFLPKLSIEFYDYAGKKQPFASMREEWDDYWIGYLKVSLPLFEGGRKVFQVKQSRYELEKVKIQRRSLADKIKKDIYSLYQDYLSASDIVSSQKLNLLKAEELWELVRKRYINGEASEIELLDANLNLISIGLAYKQAIFKQLIAYYKLLYQAGRLNKEVIIDED